MPGIGVVAGVLYIVASILKPHWRARLYLAIAALLFLGHLMFSLLDCYTTLQ